MIEIHSLPEFDGRGSITICNGTLFVPCLSGQSRFGYHTDFSNRSKLIHAVIASNMLGRFPDLQMYHDEGGQISFYQPGRPPAADDLLHHYGHMLNDLNQEFDHLKFIVARDLTLSLKLYAHYGAVAEYTCGNYHKIFGEAVAEAMELRSNSIVSHSFAMMTDEFLSACAESSFSRGGIPASNICHVYGETKHIGFVYYDYEQ